jgi:hypothetical protein
MTETELFEALKSRFGKAKREGKGYVYFPCPTCLPRNRSKLKRHASIYSYYSKCWICEIDLAMPDVLGGVEFQAVAKDGNSIAVEKEENPLARVLPCKRSIPVNQLPPDHLAVKFLNKDHLHDLDRYYNENGMIYCPSDGGTILKSHEPFVSSAERLIFPVYFNREMVGWQMRSLPGTVYGDRADVRRYYHAFNKGNYLYNYDNAKQYKMVVLTEGVKKALKFPNGVATLGKCITPMQAQLLQHWKEITVMLDSDEDSQELAQMITMNINLGTSKAVNVNLSPYGYPSPDEATAEALAIIVYHEWQKQLDETQNPAIVAGQTI